MTLDRWKQLRRTWDKDFHFIQADAEELLAAARQGIKLREALEKIELGHGEPSLIATAALGDK